MIISMSSYCPTPTGTGRSADFPEESISTVDLLTVTGKYFMVRVNAKINQYSRTGTGVLLRNDGQQLPLLLWKLE